MLLNLLLSTSDSLNEPNLLVFPNPSANQFEYLLSLPDKQPYVFQIHNATGELIYRKSGNPDSEIIKERISSSQWADGIYYVSVHAGNFLKTLKLLVQK